VKAQRGADRKNTRHVCPGARGSTPPGVLQRPRAGHARQRWAVALCEAHRTQGWGGAGPHLYEQSCNYNPLRKAPHHPAHAPKSPCFLLSSWLWLCLRLCAIQAPRSSTGYHPHGTGACTGGPTLASARGQLLFVVYYAREDAYSPWRRPPGALLIQLR